MNKMLNAFITEKIGLSCLVNHSVYYDIVVVCEVYDL